MSASYKCRLCADCDGAACAGELPGMGGVFDGKNFSLNVEGWKKILPSIPQEKLQEAAASIVPQKIRLAPITGAEENVGWPDEESFYEPFYAFAAGLGIKLGVGDKAARQDLKDYVLSDFTKAELDTLDAMFADVYDAADLIIGGNIDAAMQKYN